jgi:hypothetical protein
MTAEDRQLLADIDAATLNERGLFDLARRKRAELLLIAESLSKQRVQALQLIAQSEGMADESLDRLANYARARRLVANR